MSKKPILIVFLVLALVTGACGINIDLDVDRGSGNVVTETRDVSGFDRVILSGIGDVTLQQGDEDRLEIEAEDNIIDNITTEVVNGELRIGFDRRAIVPTEPVKFHLTMREVRGLESQGVSNIDARGITTDQLRVSISGTGNIEIRDLTADALTINVSGAGNFEAEGTATDQVVNMSGAGNYDGEDLESSTARVTIAGLGRVILWVNENLEVTISGTGGVDYYGSPRVTQQISGLGRIQHKGSK